VQSRACGRARALELLHQRAALSTAGYPAEGSRTAHHTPSARTQQQKWGTRMAAVRTKTRSEAGAFPKEFAAAASDLRASWVLFGASSPREHQHDD
jgi:hypothetical protein